MHEDDRRRALHAQLAGGALPCADDTRWEVAHPVGSLVGRDAVQERWLGPIAAALSPALRRDDLVLGGRSRVSEGEWVTTLGHVTGNFVAPLWGIPPTGKLVRLRVGAFYRLDGAGRIDRAYVLPDLIDLMRQAGCLKVPLTLGAEGVFPAPATLDGVCPPGPERSDASATLVEAMLADLRAFDPATFASAGQTGAGGYWHPDMLWFGPGGIGANVTYEGFQRDHRIPFLTAFPDRVGGNHFARFGDGDYVCSGGWPSMTMTHRGPYLGVAATGRPLTLRVMDFWRVQEGTIRENWVLLDLLDLLMQMGVDLLAQL